jgi:hypothetical protein
VHSNSWQASRCPPLSCRAQSAFGWQAAPLPFEALHKQLAFFPGKEGAAAD